MPIHVLAVTHADRDHITARKELKARFDIGQLIDNGRDYSDPSDATKDYLSYREEMKKQSRYLAFKRSARNIWAASGAIVDVLAPNRDVNPEEDSNNQCLVVRVEYKGRSFLFTGDSPLDDWVNDTTGILKLNGGAVSSQILNVSHHGSRSFFTPPGPRPQGQPEYSKEEYDVRALEKINPRLSFITCSDDEDAEHPHPIALELYQEHTNTGLPGSGESHTILSRNSKDLHYVVDVDGRLYIRTSRSRTNNADTKSMIVDPYLKGTVSSANGYLTKSGIWVSRKPLKSDDDVSFAVEAKGNWKHPISFDWWVLNNGQGADDIHREFYTMTSKDRKKQSSWKRPLAFEGVHLMQCHASADDGKQWANWCVLVCHESSLTYAHRWLEIFPGCIDSAKINR